MAVDPTFKKEKLDRKSWELLLPLDTIPSNQRKYERRESAEARGRRQASLPLTGINRRHPRAQDRRAAERRGVVVKVPIHSPLTTVYQFLRNLPNVCRLIPAVQELRKTSDGGLPEESTWEIALNLDGLPLRWWSQVRFRDSELSIIFHRLRGDLERCEGMISLSPMPGATLVTVNVYVNFGFEGLETFMGHILRGKIQESVEDALYVVKGKIEKANPAPPKFAFLIHSTDMDLYEGAFRDKRCPEGKRPLLEKLFSWMPPFKASHVYGIESPTGKIIEGDLIYSPLTPLQILHGDPKGILEHMIQAGELAQALGAKILGLGAYTAVVGRHGVQLAETLSIPVTTGTAFTIRAALDAFCEASALVGNNLRHARVTVVGATGAIGSTCSEILAPDVGALTLVARHMSKLRELSNKLHQETPALQIEVGNDLQQTVSHADMVLLCTSSPEILLDVRHLKPGTVVCDISQPHNISKESAALRNDVLVIDGGVIRPPGDVQFNFYFGLPPDSAYACMAETMILTLEERFECYSIGGNVDAKKVLEIGAWGHRHGFELGGLKSFGREVTITELERIRSVRQ